MSASFLSLNFRFGADKLLLYGFIACGLPEKRGFERVAHLVTLVVRDGIDQPVISPVRARCPSLPPPSYYIRKGAHGIRPSSGNGTAHSEPSRCCLPASSHHLPMRPPCATDYPISDFYVLPDAIRTSVPVPCGYGRCGGRENPG